MQVIQRHHALSQLINDRDSRKLFVATTNNTSASGASVGMLVSLVGVGILGIGGTGTEPRTVETEEATYPQLSRNYRILKSLFLSRGV